MVPIQQNSRFLARLPWSLALCGLALLQVPAGAATQSELTDLELETWQALQPYLVAHQAGHDALAAGRFKAAESHFQKALLEAGEDRGAALYGLTCTAALQGRSELALSRLDMALAAGYREPELIAWDPDLESLHASQEFELRMEMLAIESGDQPARTASIGRSGDGWFTQGVWLDDQTLVVGDDGGILWALDGATGEVRNRSVELGSGVWALERMPVAEGEVASEVVALLLDGSLVRWSPEQSEPLARVAGFPEREGEIKVWRPVFGGRLEWSHGGQRLAVGAANNPIQLFDVELSHVASIPGPLSNSFMAHMAWDPAGEVLLSLSKGELRAHDAQGQPVELEFEPSSKGPTENDDPLLVTEIAFAAAAPSAGGSDLVAIGWNDAWTHIHRWPTGERVVSVYVNDLFSILDITSLTFSEDGQFIGVGTASTSIAEVFRVSDGERVATTDFIGGRMGEPLALSFDPQGKGLWLNYLSGAMDLSRLDLGSEEELHTPQGAAHYHWASNWSLGGGSRRSQHGPGRTPLFNSAGLGVAISYRGLGAFDPISGHRLWQRSRLGDDESLIHTATGHFTGIPLQPPVLTWRGDKEPSDFLSLARRLHDPKRVQASAAGVRLRGEQR